MELQVYSEIHYDTQHIYPACAKSKIFAEMLRQKTLTRKNIDMLREAGYEFKLVPAPEKKPVRVAKFLPALAI